MRSLLVPLLLLLFIPVTACSGGGNDAPKAAAVADQTQLISAKCAGCHPADRGSDKRLDKAGWTTIIKRMQTRASGLISDEDAAKIIDHMAATRGPK
jgi:hypothetical protein